MLRSLLLKASDSAWLREHGVRAPFVRRAVSRFMPGEHLEDMIRAATELQPTPTVFTRLGENVKHLAEAQGVADHYLEAISRIEQMRLNAEPSIKLTQLGLDLDRQPAIDHARAIAARAQVAGSYVWIDMEQSPYVDVTLTITEMLRREFSGIGVCLQAYLHRTKEDLQRMLAIGAGVRLVKGAYREPAAVAIADKGGVDANYLTLAKSMLSVGDRATRSRLVFGTHDTDLIAEICNHARAISLQRGEYEFHMLYGIQRTAQTRLSDAGEQVRVLIAYGSYWFPWYMRRLAERPANLWFVAKNLFG